MSLETGHLYVRALCEANLEGGSYAWDPEGYVDEGSGDGHLSLGTPLGNLERNSFIGDFERWMRRMTLSVRSRWGPVESIRLLGFLGFR